MRTLNWNLAFVRLGVLIAVQMSWLLAYSFFPGGPHLIQATGFLQQVFATIFSLAALYMLVSPAFPITLLFMIFRNKISNYMQRVSRLRKLNLSLYSVWWTVLLIPVFLKFLEQLLNHPGNLIQALIFALGTLAANFSAVWLATLVITNK